MTKYRKFLLVVISVMIFGILFIMQSSVISDVTLAKGDVENYNNGWTIEYADGSTVKTDLPYFGDAGKYETVTASNTIGDKMSDKTIFFLSADKTVEIYVDDEIIYTFGTVDKREIGHTSGSVMVFADLPNYSAGKTLYIKTCSPYEGYASYFTEVKVADRDIAILYFIKNNIVALLLCIAILLCGLVTIIFAMVFQYSGQAKKARRFYSIGIYMIIMFIYHLIETKLPMIFKGNQFLYSNLVFFCLMAASLFTELYLHETTRRGRKWINTLIVLSAANIVIQMLLQMFNIVDFMEMAFVSHALLGAVIALVMISEIQEIISRKKFNPEFLGIFIMGSCAAIDLVRCYTVKVGDLGKYSRIGVFVFGISIISTCIKSIVSKQIEAAENEKTEIMSGEIIRTLITAIDAKDVYFKDYSSDVPVWSMTMEDYRVHTGIDIQSDLGADVVACAAGTISEVYCDPMMGQTIVVTHDDDCVSIYRNLQTKLPEATVVGKKVASGETIGYVGDTALIEISDSPHLHFEFVCKSDNVNPLTYFSVPAASVATSYEG